MIATATQAISPSTPVNRIQLALQRGLCLLLTAESIVAIRPIWVCMPVSVTTKVAVPRVTEVFWNTMLTLGRRGRRQSRPRAG